MKYISNILIHLCVIHYVVSGFEPITWGVGHIIAEDYFYLSGEQSNRAYNIHCRSDSNITKITITNIGDYQIRLTDCSDGFMDLILPSNEEYKLYKMVRYLSKKVEGLKDFYLSTQLYSTDNSNDDSIDNFGFNHYVYNYFHRPCICHHTR
jgi:hypothetical protein